MFQTWKTTYLRKRVNERSKNVHIGGTKRIQNGLNVEWEEESGER